MRPAKVWQLDIWPAEKAVISIALVVGAVDLVQIAYRGIKVDWSGYGLVFGVALVAFAAGQLYRRSGRSARLGAALTCTSIMILFTASMSVFNYLLMPIERPMIDELLVRIDALFGYHWPDMVAFGAEHPIFNAVTRYAYMSTMPQLALLVVVLGLSGQVRALHVLLVCLAITATMVVAFWGVFPSHGPSALFTLPEDVQRAADPVVGTSYGRELVRMAQEGPSLLSPSEVKGLIGFPSYHAALACLAVYCARTIRWLFPVYIVVNLLILPGTLIHGGHHFVDVPAGIALFLIGVWLTEKAVDYQYKAGGQPAVLAQELGR